jgi:hypothetical protein
MTYPVTRRVRTAAVFAAAAAVLASCLVALGLQRTPVLILPVILASLPLLARSDGALRALTFVALIGVGLYVLLGAMTIGFLYVPSFVALLVAADVVRQQSDLRPKDK